MSAVERFCRILRTRNLRILSFVFGLCRWTAICSAFIVRLLPNMTNLPFKVGSGQNQTWALLVRKIKLALRIFLALLRFRKIPCYTSPPKLRSSSLQAREGKGRARTKDDDGYVVRIAIVCGQRGPLGRALVQGAQVLRARGLLPPSHPRCTVRTGPGAQCAVASDIAGAVRHKPPPPRRSRVLGFGCTPLPDPPRLSSCLAYPRHDMSAAADAASPRAAGLPKPDRFREDHELAGAV